MAKLYWICLFTLQKCISEYIHWEQSFLWIDFCLYVSLQESDFNDIPDALKLSTLIVGALVVIVITAAVLEGGFAEACVAICVSVFTIIPILLEFSRQVRYFLLFLDYGPSFFVNSADSMINFVPWQIKVFKLFL